MRPIKLRLSAFGPYANEQLIDFTKLDSQNIFLITGPTGAGKTTIFDAISYVLFGTASGNDRENDSLRSDFASDDVETFVEMEFEISNEIYIIKRKPAQLKRKKRGEGYTQQSAEAILHLPSGDTITKSEAVTNKIEEILGINKQQFKQIVMLPQGEFKKLLLAESKEKESIFRKIFGTYDYQQIQLKLKDRALELKKEVDKYRAEVAINLKGISAEDDIFTNEYMDFAFILDKLKELLKEDEKIKKSIDENINKIREEKLLINREIINGENINSLFSEKDNLENSIKGYKDNEIEQKKKENLISNIRKAIEVKIIEDSYLQKQREKIKNQQEIEKINSDIKEKEIEIEENTKKLQIVGNDEEKLNEIDKEIHSYRENLKQLSSLKEQENKVTNLEKEYETNAKYLSELKIKKDNLIKAKEKKELEQKNILVYENEYTKINIKIEEKDKLIKILRNIYKEIQEIKKLNNSHKALKTEYNLLEKSYKNNKYIYDEMELAFRKGQAGILASKLIENSPCPVCGSLEHPNPAKQLETVPSEEKLNEVREEYEKIKVECDEKLAQLKLLIEKIKIKEEETISNLIKDANSYLEDDLEYGENLEDKTKILGGQLKKELEEMGNKKDKLSKEIDRKEIIEKEVNSLNEEYNSILMKLEKEEEIKTNLYGSLQKESEILNNLKSKLPEKISSIEELKLIINKKEIEVADFKNNLKLLNDRELDLQKKISLLEGNRNSLEKVINQIIIEEKELNNNFNMKIQELFNDINEYNTVKGYSKKELMTLEEEIKNFNEEYKSLKDRYIDIVNKTKDLKIVNIDDLKNEANRISLQEKELDKESKEIYSRIDNNRKRFDLIKSLGEKVIKREEEYKVIGELAEISNGRKAPYITFESFVLASYFEEIILAANIRLSKMTGDRFLLKRKVDKGKGAGQKGLELEVFDNYTGKVRHVKTLSGGESFKASLSLALGLSDVIQESAGGVKLDTMFIDEGFGTLDPESLDNAISCLLDLQRGGRLVGIISHVPELKERIEMKLQIETSTNGSKAKFIS